MRGMKNKEGHCICVMNGQIVDVLCKTSLPLEKDNLVYVLGEDVIELAFCYIFYPKRKFILEVIEIEIYQQLKNRKNQRGEIIKTC